MCRVEDSDRYGRIPAVHVFYFPDGNSYRFILGDMLGDVIGCVDFSSFPTCTRLNTVWLNCLDGHDEWGGRTPSSAAGRAPSVEGRYRPALPGASRSLDVHDIQKKLQKMKNVKTAQHRMMDEQRENETYCRYLARLTAYYFKDRTAGW